MMRRNFVRRSFTRGGRQSHLQPHQQYFEQYYDWHSKYTAWYNGVMMQQAQQYAHPMHHDGAAAATTGTTHPQQTALRGQQQWSSNVQQPHFACGGIKTTSGEQVLERGQISGFFYDFLPLVFLILFVVPDGYEWSLALQTRKDILQAVEVAKKESRMQKTAAVGGASPATAASKK